MTFSNKIRDVIYQRGLLYPLDVALVGATGVGKSSTINALFGNDVAKVGSGVDPETMHITKYQISDVLRFHDTAGLGDNIASDITHSENLSKLLLDQCVEKNTSISYGLIDLVFVILDGSNRDMGTTYRLLESIILKNIEPTRVIVGINQCDVAMKGRHWNSHTLTPDSKLLQFLDEKALSVQKRLKEATGLSINKPVYYSAEYKYNLIKLMSHIIQHIPHGRRIIR